MSAKWGDKTVTCFVDTGADVSVLPASLINNDVQLQPIKETFMLRGFDGEEKQSVTSSAFLTLNLGGVEISGKFYVCKANYVIIGCDLLRDPLMKISMDTKTGILNIAGKHLPTDNNPADSLISLRLRLEKEESSSQCERENWVRLKKDVVIPPFQSRTIRLECEQKCQKEKENVFLSLTMTMTRFSFPPSNFHLDYATSRHLLKTGQRRRYDCANPLPLVVSPLMMILHRQIASAYSVQMTSGLRLSS